MGVMKLVRILFMVIASLVLVFLAVQIYGFSRQQAEAQQQFNQLNNSVTAVQQTQASLKDEMAYIANPENLEKELRARFNYRSPNEKLMIIVPEGNAPTSTTSSISSD